MSAPTPAERLVDRLDRLPAACRAILGALERAQLHGGGVVLVRLEVGPDGGIEAIELPQRYTREIRT